MNDTAAASVIVEVNEANFATEVEQATMPVFVDFWAPWCGPCKALAPMFDRLAETYGDQIKFAKVNTDDNKELAKRLDVRGLPTLLMFRDGQVVERTSGAQSKSHFSNLLDKYVTAPVATAAAVVPVRHFRAFYGDAALRDAVVSRVRGHIENDRILSYGGSGPLSDTGSQRYSLMAAALESADSQRYEGTLGIPADAARVAEVVHSLSMREVEVAGEKQYHLRDAGKLYPLEWLQAIPPGADLAALTPRFIHWYLTDLVSGTYLYESKVIPEVREMALRVAHLHERQAMGDAPTPAQWKETRTTVGEALERLRAGQPDLFSRMVATISEMLAWPVEELEEALAGAIGTVFYALWQNALPLAYSPEQWAERMALLKAAQDRQTASPEATPEQMAAFEEIKAFRTFMEGCEAKDNATGLEAKYAYGDHLHTGLMRVLAETVKVTA